MKIVHLYTGDDGESHFEDTELDMPSDALGVLTSELRSAKGAMFNTWPAGHDLGWHPAPRRQYVAILSGRVEFEIGDGTKRQFGPGDVLLADDTTGRGHQTRVVGDQPRNAFVVPLAD
jgi:quercetin dioxygenase-like cupin family protein